MHRGTRIFPSTAGPPNTVKGDRSRTSSGPLETPCPVRLVRPRRSPPPPRRIRAPRGNKPHASRAASALGPWLLSLIPGPDMGCGCFPTKFLARSQLGALQVVAVDRASLVFYLGKLVGAHRSSRILVLPRTQVRSPRGPCGPRPGLAGPSGPWPSLLCAPPRVGVCGRACSARGPLMDRLAASDSGPGLSLLSSVALAFLTRGPLMDRLAASDSGPGLSLLSSVALAFLMGPRSPVLRDLGPLFAPGPRSFGTFP